MSAGNILLNALYLLEVGDVDEGKVIADFGCGHHGHLVLPASRLVGDDGIVYAVDLLPNNLKMLKNRCAQVGYINTRHIWGDFERNLGVDIPEKIIDTVFFINNLWQTDLQKALSEIKRVLKEDGHLVIVDWHKHSDHPIAPEKSARMSDVEAYQILKNSGCSVVERLDISPAHWGLKCKFDE